MSMRIIEFNNEENIISYLNDHSWIAGRFLYELIVKNKIYDVLGKDTKIIVMLDGNDIVFKCTQINQQELIEDMNKVPKSKSAIENASFTPLQVVLLMIIRYYMITKQKEKLKAIYYYYGYSIYWSLYGQFLKKYL